MKIFKRDGTTKNSIEESGIWKGFDWPESHKWHREIDNVATKLLVATEIATTENSGKEVTEGVWNDFEWPAFNLYEDSAEISTVEEATRHESGESSTVFVDNALTNENKEKNESNENWSNKAKPKTEPTTEVATEKGGWKKFTWPKEEVSSSTLRPLHVTNNKIYFDNDIGINGPTVENFDFTLSNQEIDHIVDNDENQNEILDGSHETGEEYSKNVETQINNDLGEEIGELGKSPPNGEDLAPKSFGEYLKTEDNLFLEETEKSPQILMEDGNSDNYKTGSEEEKFLLTPFENNEAELVSEENINSKVNEDYFEKPQASSEAAFELIPDNTHNFSEENNEDNGLDEELSKLVATLPSDVKNIVESEVTEDYFKASSERAFESIPGNSHNFREENSEDNFNLDEELSKLLATLPDTVSDGRIGFNSDLEQGVSGEQLKFTPLEDNEESQKSNLEFMTNAAENGEKNADHDFLEELSLFTPVVLEENSEEHSKIGEQFPVGGENYFLEEPSKFTSFLDNNEDNNQGASNLFKYIEPTESEEESPENYSEERKQLSFNGNGSGQQQNEENEDNRVNNKISTSAPILPQEKTLNDNGNAQNNVVLDEEVTDMGEDNKFVTHEDEDFSLTPLSREISQLFDIEKFVTREDVGSSFSPLSREISQLFDIEKELTENDASTSLEVISMYHVTEDNLNVEINSLHNEPVTLVEHVDKNLDSFEEDNEGVDVILQEKLENIKKEVTSLLENDENFLYNDNEINVSPLSIGTNGRAEFENSSGARSDKNEELIKSSFTQAMDKNVEDSEYFATPLSSDSSFFNIETTETLSMVEDFAKNEAKTFASEQNNWNDQKTIQVGDESSHSLAGGPNEMFDEEISEFPNYLKETSSMRVEIGLTNKIDESQDNSNEDNSETNQFGVNLEDYNGNYNYQPNPNMQDNKLKIAGDNEIATPRLEGKTNSEDINGRDFYEKSSGLHESSEVVVEKTSTEFLDGDKVEEPKYVSEETNLNDEDSKKVGDELSDSLDGAPYEMIDEEISEFPDYLEKTSSISSELGLGNKIEDNLNKENTEANLGDYNGHYDYQPNTNMQNKELKIADDNEIATSRLEGESNSEDINGRDFYEKSSDLPESTEAVVERTSTEFLDGDEVEEPKYVSGESNLNDEESKKVGDELSDSLDGTPYEMIDQEISEFPDYLEKTSSISSEFGLGNKIEDNLNNENTEANLGDYNYQPNPNIEGGILENAGNNEKATSSFDRESNSKGNTKVAKHRKDEKKKERTTTKFLDAGEVEESIGSFSRFPEAPETSTLCARCAEFANVEKETKWPVEIGNFVPEVQKNHETSTLCEICDSNAEAATITGVRSFTKTTRRHHEKNRRTSVIQHETSTKKIKNTPSGIQLETSTLCEICDEDSKDSHKHTTKSKSKGDLVLDFLEGRVGVTTAVSSTQQFKKKHFSKQTDKIEEFLGITGDSGTEIATKGSFRKISLSKENLTPLTSPQEIISKGHTLGVTNIEGVETITKEPEEFGSSQKVVTWINKETAMISEEITEKTQKSHDNEEKDTFVPAIFVTSTLVASHHDKDVEISTRENPEEVVYDSNDQKELDDVSSNELKFSSSDEFEMDKETETERMSQDHKHKMTTIEESEVSTDKEFNGHKFHNNEQEFTTMEESEVSRSEERNESVSHNHNQEVTTMEESEVSRAKEFKEHHYEQELATSEESEINTDTELNGHKFHNHEQELTTMEGSEVSRAEDLHENVSHNHEQELTTMEESEVSRGKEFKEHHYEQELATSEESEVTTEKEINEHKFHNHEQELTTLEESEVSRAEELHESVSHNREPELTTSEESEVTTEREINEHKFHNHEQELTTLEESEVSRAEELHESVSHNREPELTTSEESEVTTEKEINEHKFHNHEQELTTQKESEVSRAEDLNENVSHNREPELTTSEESEVTTEKEIHEHKFHNHEQELTTLEESEVSRAEELHESVSHNREPELTTSEESEVTTEKEIHEHKFHNHGQELTTMEEAEELNEHSSHNHEQKLTTGEELEVSENEELNEQLSHDHDQERTTIDELEVGKETIKSSLQFLEETTSNEMSDVNGESYEVSSPLMSTGATESDMVSKQFPEEYEEGDTNDQKTNEISSESPEEKGTSTEIVTEEYDENEDKTNVESDDSEEIESNLETTESEIDSEVTKNVEEDSLTLQVNTEEVSKESSEEYDESFTYNQESNRKSSDQEENEITSTEISAKEYDEEAISQNSLITNTREEEEDNGQKLNVASTESEINSETSEELEEANTTIEDDRENSSKLFDEIIQNLPATVPEEQPNEHEDSFTDYEEADEISSKPILSENIVTSEFGFTSTKSGINSETSEGLKETITTIKEDRENNSELLVKSTESPPEEHKEHFQKFDKTSSESQEKAAASTETFVGENISNDETVSSKSSMAELNTESGEDLNLASTESEIKSESSGKPEEIGITTEGDRESNSELFAETSQGVAATDSEQQPKEYEEHHQKVGRVSSESQENSVASESIMTGLNTESEEEDLNFTSTKSETSEELQETNTFDKTEQNSPVTIAEQHPKEHEESFTHNKGDVSSESQEEAVSSTKISVDENISNEETISSEIIITGLSTESEEVEIDFASTESEIESETVQELNKINLTTADEAKISKLLEEITESLQVTTSELFPEGFEDQEPKQISSHDQYEEVVTETGGEENGIEIKSSPYTESVSLLNSEETEENEEDDVEYNSTESSELNAGLVSTQIFVTVVPTVTEPPNEEKQENTEFEYDEELTHNPKSSRTNPETDEISWENTSIEEYEELVSSSSKKSEDEIEGGGTSSDQRMVTVSDVSSEFFENVPESSEGSTEEQHENNLETAEVASTEENKEEHVTIFGTKALHTSTEYEKFTELNNSGNGTSKFDSGEKQKEIEEGQTENGAVKNNESTENEVATTEAGQLEVTEENIEIANYSSNGMQVSDELEGKSTEIVGQDEKSYHKITEEEYNTSEDESQTHENIFTAQEDKKQSNGEVENIETKSSTVINENGVESSTLEWGNERFSITDYLQYLTSNEPVTSSQNELKSTTNGIEPATGSVLQTQVSQNSKNTENTPIQLEDTTKSNQDDQELKPQFSSDIDVSTRKNTFAVSEKTVEVLSESFTMNEENTENHEMEGTRPQSDNGVYNEEIVRTSSSKEYYDNELVSENFEEPSSWDDRELFLITELPNGGTSQEMPQDFSEEETNNKAGESEGSNGRESADFSELTTKYPYSTVLAPLQETVFEIEYENFSKSADTLLRHNKTNFSENDVEDSEDGIKRKKTTNRMSVSDALKFSTTLMLLLSTAYGNTTQKTKQTTRPAIYIDLPVFTPKITHSTVAHTSSHNDLEKTTNKMIWDEAKANEAVTSSHYDLEKTTNKMIWHEAKPNEAVNNSQCIILYVNGPPGSNEKLNGTKWSGSLGTAEIFVEPTISPHQPYQQTTNTEMENFQPQLPENIASDGCSKTDFDEGKNCFCAIDKLIKQLTHDLTKLTSPTTPIDCPSFLKVTKGLVIGNDSVPEIRKRRSYMFGVNDGEIKREIIDYTKGFFNEDFQVKNTETRIYTLPDTKIVIPCLNKNEVVEFNRYMKYSWMFEDDVQITDDHVVEGNLELNHVLPKDSGNYSCSVTSRLSEKDDSVQKYYHRLIVTSSPFYKIKTTIMYSLNKTCDLVDGDVLFNYLPKMFNELICGFQETICKTVVRRPRCLNHNNENLINVTFIVTMNHLQTILAGLDNNICNINCQMNVYSKLAAILLRNIKTIEQLPVFSNLDLREVDFVPKAIGNESEQEHWSSSPVLIIACPAGFGVEKKHPRICVVCPKNSYSTGNTSYCKMCPPGQYQPAAGSALCIICSSPLENAACLRVLYADAEHFKMYIGVAVSSILVLIIAIICFTNSKRNMAKSNSKTSNMFKSPKRNYDVEQGATEPLLRKESQKRGSKVVPPEPPPLDF